MEAIGTHDEQIVGGLHWKEAHTIHLHADGTVEQADGRAHGGFELNDLLGIRVGGIHGLLVANHRQWQHTIVFGKLGLERVNANPDGVRIEVRVLLDILSRCLVVRMHLTHLAQHQSAAGLVTHDVTALAVGLGADGNLCHKRCAGVLEMLGQRAGWASTEIIGIGDEEILEAVLLEHIEQTGLPNSGEQVAVSRRAPFQIRVFREADGLAGGSHQLWLLMLDDFHRDFVLRELAVALEHLHGVSRSAEGVHEGQRQLDVQTGAGGQHLTDDDVDEAHLPGLVAAHRQQGLGAFQTHGGAKTAVKLEERGFCKRVHGLVVIDGLVNIVEAGNLLKRLHIVLSDPV